MKTVAPSKQIASNIDDNEKQQFTIAVNHKSFRILLDKLYTDKIMSIIRELWTNAYDAHVARGCESTPFECHLPNVYDPQFYVRDFGISMDHEEVMHLYTTVFESSKDHSNKYVGMLGLGSKSPFCYVDSFMVQCYKNRKVRSYIAAVGPDGVPTITYLGEEATKEPRGTKISFAAQPTHFVEFRRKAEIVAKGFDVVPIFVDAEIMIPKPVAQFNNWKLYRDSDPYVKQGCVLYPLTGVPIPHNYYKGLVVDMPIGSVQITANREALSVDDATKTNVLEAFKAAYDEIPAYFEKKIENAKNTLEAAKILNDLDAFHYIPYGQRKLKFKGRDLPQYIAIEGLNLYDSKWKSQRVKQFYVANINNLEFIIERTDQKVLRRRLRVRDYDKNNRKQVFVLIDPDKQTLKGLVRKLGLDGSQIIPISKLPDVTVTRNYAPKSQGNGSTDPYMMGWYFYSSGNWSNNHLERVKRDKLAKDYYWLPIDDGKAVTISYDGRFSYAAWSFRDIEDYQTVFKDFLRQIPLYYLTPKMQIAQKPEDNFLTAVIEAFKKNDKAIISKIQQNILIARLNQAHPKLMTPAIYEKLIGIKHTSLHLPRNMDRMVKEAIPSFNQEAAKKEAGEKVVEIVKKYPMIFPSPNEETILQYIKEKS